MSETFDQRIARRLAPIFREFERDMQQSELRRIKEDPAAHRDTRLMGPKGLRWRYYERRKGKTRVRFCWATVPNAAGYWLTWQETRTATEVRREYIRGHDRRKDARESALKGYENFGR